MEAANSACTVLPLPPRAEASVAAVCGQVRAGACTPACAPRPTRGRGFPYRTAQVSHYFKALAYQNLS